MEPSYAIYNWLLYQEIKLICLNPERPVVVSLNYGNILPSKNIKRIKLKYNEVKILNAFVLNRIYLIYFNI